VTAVITSPDNPRLKQLTRLQQHPAAYRKEGVALLEGEHVWREWLAWGQGRFALQAVFYSAEFPELLEGREQVMQRAVAVPHALLGKFASGNSAFHVLALLETNKVTCDLLGSKFAINNVVLDGVQDAGNVGSIMRSAAGAGARRVLLGPGCAAAWSPKVMRAARGAHFHVQVTELASLDAVLAALADDAAPLYAADVSGQYSVFDAPLVQPCNWAFGNEGQGLSASLLAACTERLRIPQAGPQSLNVAAAAAVCMFESLRRSAIK
jgi:RNA methyltransferase, TrmH family